MFKVTQKDKKRYVLTEKEDYIILEKIYELEKSKLSSEDKELVTLIRTQLERGWRTPLVTFLDKLLKKYSA
ncbi:MAG: hypothetical protein HY457_03390 [Parcubacteria group bacterium]|nr:hypothetical protein [Parcubacteria group bacterium]